MYTMRLNIINQSRIQTKLVTLIAVKISFEILILPSLIYILYNVTVFPFLEKSSPLVSSIKQNYRR